MAQRRSGNMGAHRRDLADRRLVAQARDRFSTTQVTIRQEASGHQPRPESDVIELRSS